MFKLLWLKKEHRKPRINGLGENGANRKNNIKKRTLPTNITQYREYFM